MKISILVTTFFWLLTALNAKTLETPQLEGEEELKSKLSTHLEFIKTRLPKNPQSHFKPQIEKNKNQEKTDDKVELGKKLGKQSKGVVFRTGHVKKESQFQINYRVKIDLQKDFAFIGPFSSDKITLPKNSNTVLFQDEKNNKETIYNNIEIKIGELYIDLYEINETEYLVGNVFIQNDKGQLKYFGQTIIRRIKS